jgi:TRAP-type C4-dicarboxylate transport system substrate-binding protein
MKGSLWIRSAALLAAAVLASAAALAQPIVIKFPHDLAPSTPKGQGAERFKQLAEAELPASLSCRNIAYSTSRLSSGRQPAGSVPAIQYSKARTR